MRGNGIRSWRLEREKYSLTSQLVRSSRSISANITEGWAKIEYANLFRQHLIHALGSNADRAIYFTGFQHLSSIFQHPAFHF
ncbi:four helix bundle protein [Aliifodinibius sp. S!AR15-10]|uniref:four helix bundle protein n=1 Tax=Aliifodinibius sp. S!AR15-10 TaxID=2950437 RepID=UPI0038F6F2E2